MLKKNYDWKRFWCPPSGRINLGDGGYLCDPDDEWGKAYNPDLVSLEVVADVPCLILLGEPGIGKSNELGELKLLTEKIICKSSKVLELNLRSCTNLKVDLFGDEIFTDWLRGDYHLYLFLDSLDEGLFSVRTLATGLVDELRKPKYQAHINRLRFRLACRTLALPEVLEEGLKELWKEDCFKIYELVPLRRTDVIKAAKAESLSVESFLKELDQKNAIPLAIKPITLKFLINTYQKYKGKFPSSQKLYEFYLEGCKLLCEEVNRSRLASGYVGKLDSNQRLMVAARIAAVTIFTNKFAIWTNVDEGSVPVEDVLLQRLCFGYEKIDGREIEITKEVIREVLDTGLFSSRGLYRIGWAHQTYAECLAAWYLTKKELSLSQIAELIFSSEDPEHRLIPQLHETAAWLASMRPDIFQEIIRTDPDVLLQTDVQTDVEIKAAVVDNLLAKYEEGKLFDRGRNNYHQYAKLKHPGLAEQLRLYISDATKQVDARDLAIDIAEVCKLSELQDDLVELALDSSQPVYLRVGAAKAICSFDDTNARAKLKPLAIEPLPEDEDDRLKGWVLQALWPNHLTSEELFQVLTPPKKRNFLGGYQMFLDYYLIQNLKLDDVVTALNWLEKQGVRCLGTPFEKLGNHICVEGWKHLDSPGVANAFAKVVLVQLKEYQQIISNDDKLHEEFTSLILNDETRRRLLIESIVSIVLKEEAFVLLNSKVKEVVLDEDMLWIVSNIKTSRYKPEESIWITLAKRIFQSPELMPKEAQAILEISQTNSNVQNEFLYWLKTIDLDSPQAVKLYVSYFEYEIFQDYKFYNLSSESYSRNLTPYLDELEHGDLSAWWRLNLELTIESDGKHHYSEMITDLTELPGWNESDLNIRNRIIRSAQIYIQSHRNVSYRWIGTGSYDRDALSGVRALQLLLKEKPDFIDTLSFETWVRWIPIIIAAPSVNKNNDFYLELIKIGYLNAPKEFLKALLLLIDKENCYGNYISSLERLKKCLDKKIQMFLLEKIKDPELKPEYFGKILEELMIQGCTKADDFAKSTIRLPLPIDRKEREKVLIATRALVENSNSSSWSHVWGLIRQDSSFGREVLELAAIRYSHGIQLNLNEAQLANLYIWLVEQYPYEEDPDHSNEVMAYSITARDGIAALRDSVLSQLEEKGTLQACAEVQRIIESLPDLSWLRRTLIAAQANMRRNTWTPLTPEDFLQLVINQEPSRRDLFKTLSKIDERTEKMEKEPKVDKSINITGSSVPGVVNTGDGEIKNVLSSPTPKKGFDWKFWLTIMIGLITVMASGLFNSEIRSFLFNQDTPSQVEQKLENHP